MSKAKNKRQGKAKFLLIDGYIKRSSAWDALSTDDIVTYLELKWRYDGYNNGRIGLGCRELAGCLKSSKSTAIRSLNNLVHTGFVAKAKPSGFNVKNRMATEWRLTEYQCDVSGQPATKDFMRWSAENKTQGHQRDAQGHQRDSNAVASRQKVPDRATRGTVKAISPTSQAHQRDTYNTTMGGNVDAA